MREVIEHHHVQIPRWPINIVGPKIEILKFEQGKKSDHHFQAKFSEKSISGGLEAKERYLDFQIGQHRLIIVGKNKLNLKFRLTLLFGNQMVMVSKPKNMSQP